jgi:histidyl-tRNA synthetase
MSLVAPLLDGGEIEFSPFLARGLDYYTGPIFEVYLKEASGVIASSAIASGGRYDNLIGTFAGKQVPACGGSLGIDRLLSIIKHSGDQIRENTLSPQVFITVRDRASRAEVLSITDELRNEGISTEISLTEGKISDQLRYASKRGAHYCLFYGPDEQIKKEVTLKNLTTSEQRSVKREQIALTLKSFIQKR